VVLYSYTGPNMETWDFGSKSRGHLNLLSLTSVSNRRKFVYVAWPVIVHDAVS
jgi:hypothetical protein